MIIDGHQHVMLPTTFQLAKMDEAGVDKAVLFTTTPHVEKAEKATLKEISREMAVLYNILNGSYTVEERLAKIKEIITELKTAISVAPDRFAGFGTTPLGLSEKETSQWVEDYVVSNSFKGVGEYTPGSCSCSTSPYYLSQCLLHCLLQISDPPSPILPYTKPYQNYQEICRDSRELRRDTGIVF